MRFETEIKQWGNSLALRISAPMAQEPEFVKGTKVIVDTSDGVLKVERKEKTQKFKLPFTEMQLLNGLDEHTAHADALAVLSDKESTD